MFIVTVLYKDIDENGKPFTTKEKFTVKAANLNKAKVKAEKAMTKQSISEYVIEDITRK